jgi:hypothetical protein
MSEGFWAKKVEEEFIAGERDDLIPSADEVKVELSSVTNDLVFTIKKSILEALIPQVILVSQKSISEYKYPLDATDATDGNNIKLAREVAEKVYNLLPQILSEVGANIEKILGEN